MANAFDKGILRSIKGSLGRFIAIAAIVALGAGFYAGLRMTCPDMKLAADEFYDNTELMDIRIVSTLGLTDDDIDALREIEGVKGVMGAYEVDIMAEVDGEGYVMRVHSLPEAAYESDTSSGVSAESDDDDYLNRPILTSGRWPTEAGECVISSDIVIGTDIEIGDVITVTEVAEGYEDVLVTTELVVVGTVSSSYYATSANMGSTSLGSGSIQDYLYVCEDEFSEDTPYTEIFLTVEGAAEVNNSTDEYDEIVEAVEELIEEIAEERADERTEEVLGDAQEELDEAWEEYEEERAEVEDELEEAQEELDEALEQLEAAEEELDEGQASYDEGVAELEEQSQELDEEIAAAEEELEAAQETYDEAMATRASLVSQLEEAQDGLDEVDAGLAELEAALSEVNSAIEELEAALSAMATLTTMSEASEEGAVASGAEDEAVDEQASSGEATDEAATEDSSADESAGEDASSDEVASEGSSADESTSVDDSSADESAGEDASAEESATEDSSSGDASGGEAASEGSSADDDSSADESASADGAAAGGSTSADASTDGSAAAAAAAAAEQLASLQASAEDLAEQYAELSATQQSLQSAVSQLEAAIAAIDEQTDGVPEQIAAGWAELESQEAEAEAQIAAAQEELDAAAEELKAAREELEEAQEEYEDGVAELEDARAEAEEGFAEAEEELEEAQGEIDAVEAAEWYIMDRDENYGVVAYEADAERIDSIASVFPLIFFLVAALVALTTMTRMVEEERTVIGTFKALGYSKGRIAWRYLSYALLASVIGSIVGIAILSQVLPAVIMYAYAIIYFVPTSDLPIDTGIAAFSAGVSIGVTALATVASVLASLREKPSSLMLPRTPKAGKRILLERITPLWSRLSFSWKVTCRNIFRDKKRFAMTVIGVAGCTSLLLTGLGLSDSINDIIDLQFEDIWIYNATIVTDAEEMDEEAEAELEELLSDEEYVTNSLRVGLATMSAYGAEGDENVKVQVVATSDIERLSDFIDLRTRLDQEDVELSDDGVVLTEKLADKLGVEVGDSIELVEQDAIGNPTGESHTMVVTGIVENYIYDYAYTGPGGWEELAGEDATFESIYAICTTDEDLREEFSDLARSIDGVNTVSYSDETIETYRTMIESVNLIVIVLIVAAAALDFIVVYNLTNINIAERVREIATLKVLGFTKGETEAYVYRETILLTIVGALLGLVFGVFLESYVVTTAEVDQVMFGRSIHSTTFLLGFFLTVAFTAFVMFVMRGKIAKVSMVESLKSNE